MIQLPMFFCSTFSAAFWSRLRLARFCNQMSIYPYLSTYLSVYLSLYIFLSTCPSNQLQEPAHLRLQTGENGGQRLIAQVLHASQDA